MAEMAPQAVMEQVRLGSERLKNFRKARLMFLKSYVGPYYDKQKGEMGKEPLNLIFNAIRSLVPHIVMTNPRHNVKSRYLSYKEYAELLSLTLEESDRQLNIETVYRRGIVDAIFTLATFKTGLAQSESLYAINDYDNVDAGTVFTEVVDFDNLVVDPRSREHLFADADFIGDRLCVPRSVLLESGLYRNDLVERLPKVGGGLDKEARGLSMGGVKGDDIYGDSDYVEIVEVWVPGANALITVPGDEDATADDYLRVEDYYGPKEGPYTFLALTPPVPGNPLPIPSVGIWHDLHLKANEMAVKIIEQASRQKDIVAYKPGAEDDAEELRNAADGSTVAVDDPESIATLSFGGQKNSNETQLASLASWFSMMSSNPEQLSGASSNADSATAASILNQNANIGLEDVKGLVYKAAQSEARKRAWFFHTDPLINMPLIRQRMIPGQMINGQMIPAQRVPEQVMLTPEQRRGDFLDFNFSIEPESMGKKDGKVRYAQMMDFCTKILPGIMTGVQAATMMGLPLSPKVMLENAARDAGMDWFDEVFYDPEFQMQMMAMQMRGPQPDGNAAAGGQASPAAMMQNGQPGNVGAGSTPPEMQMMQGFQEGANQGQAALKTGGY